MASTPKTYADVPGFIMMLQAACGDPGMKETLEMLLSMSDETRKDVVRTLLTRFRESQAPQSLIEAFACLLDDEAAEKAYEAIYQCKRR